MSSIFCMSVPSSLHRAAGSRPSRRENAFCVLGTRQSD